MRIEWCSPPLEQDNDTRFQSQKNNNNFLNNFLFTHICWQATNSVQNYFTEFLTRISRECGLVCGFYFYLERAVMTFETGSGASEIHSGQCSRHSRSLKLLSQTSSVTSTIVPWPRPLLSLSLKKDGLANLSKYFTQIDPKSINTNFLCRVAEDQREKSPYSTRTRYAADCLISSESGSFTFDCWLHISMAMLQWWDMF